MGSLKAAFASVCSDYMRKNIFLLGERTQERNEEKKSIQSETSQGSWLSGYREQNLRLAFISTFHLAPQQVLNTSNK